MMTACAVAIGLPGCEDGVAALRLPASDRDKDVEILAVRYQIAVLERRLGDKKLRLTRPAGPC